MREALEGQCHCGGLRWRFEGRPESGTVCNCTLCRRYGVIWAYDFEGERVSVEGRNMAYIWGDETLGFHFRPDCGCIGYWRALAADGDGRRRLAVNLRMAEPAAVQDIPLRKFDGLVSFDALPDSGGSLRHMWF